MSKELAAGQEQVKIAVTTLREEMKQLMQDHRKDVCGLLHEKHEELKRHYSHGRPRESVASPSEKHRGDHGAVRDQPHRHRHRRAETAAELRELMQSGGRPTTRRADGLGEPVSLAELVSKVMPCLGSVARRVDHCLCWFGQGMPPEKTDCLSRFVDSTFFRVFIYFSIIFNVAFMAYAADEEVRDYLIGQSEFVHYGELVFIGIYTAEIVLRVWRDGSFFWHGRDWKYNWLDFVLVAASYALLFFRDGVIPNVSWLRMLRLLKLIKVLRIFRLVAMFKVLRAILVSIAETLGTLCWSVMILAIILFTFGLTFTLLTGNYFSGLGSDLDEATRDELLEYYGSVSTSIVTLYMCVTGGHDWGPYYHALQNIGFFSAALLLFFVFFTQIAVLNIILGMFVNQAMKSMQAEREEAALEHAEEEKKNERDLMKILEGADVEGEGRITVAGWQKAFGNSNVPAFLDLMGYKAQDVLAYYKLLSRTSDDGSVDLSEFTAGCMMMKGTATKFDMHILHDRLTELERLFQTVAGAGTETQGLWMSEGKRLVHPSSGAETGPRSPPRSEDVSL
jgi:voltage-gated sodium channel